MSRTNQKLLLMREQMEQEERRHTLENTLSSPRMLNDGSQGPQTMNKVLENPTP